MKVDNVSGVSQNVGDKAYIRAIKMKPGQVPRETEPGRLLHNDEIFVQRADLGREAANSGIGPVGIRYSQGQTAGTDSSSITGERPSWIVPLQGSECCIQLGSVVAEQPNILVAKNGVSAAGSIEQLIESGICIDIVASTIVYMQEFAIRIGKPFRLEGFLHSSILRMIGHESAYGIGYWTCFSTGIRS